MTKLDRIFLLALSLLKAWNQPMATLTDERKQLRAPRNELGAARKELGAARKVAKGRTEYSVRLCRIFRSPLNCFRSSILN